MITNQREKSGLPLMKYTVDPTHVLPEHLCDFCPGLLAIYINLRKTFDSVSIDVLKRILVPRRISIKLVPLILGLYSGGVCSAF